MDAEGRQAPVDVVGGGVTVREDGDEVAVEAEEGGEAGDAEFGRAAEVGLGRVLCSGRLEGGDDGLGVQTGGLGDLPVGGGVGEAQAVDVEGPLEGDGEVGGPVGAAWRRAATPRAAASESITKEPSAISRS